MVRPDNLLVTFEYVRQALDDLIKITNERINPLQFLHLVDEYMLRADFSFFQNPRLFALNELLVSVIRDQYVNLRSLYNMPAPQIGVDQATAAKIIKEDAASYNPDLIGWTWLYFRYVEANLHVSQQWYCDTVKLDDRTVRRYQNHAINQLTKRLIQSEQKARENHRKKILTLQLPHQGTIPTLVERDRELGVVQNSVFKHFCISGAPGVGKSVFVEFCLQEKIKNNELDQILWFEHPKNVEYIKFHLQERLLVEDTKITVTEYISIKQVAIVLDDSDYLLGEKLQLEMLFQELSNAYIFLTSQLFQPISGCLQVNLHELSTFGTSALLRQLHVINEAPEDNQYAWQRVGGNPLAIQLLTQNWTLFDIQVAASLTLEHVFLDMYQSLQSSERLAWLILALLDNTATLNDLIQFESEFIHVDDFVKLSRLSIATKGDNSRISLTSTARHFIELCYQSTPEIKMALEDLVRYLDKVNANKTELLIGLVESILSNNWTQISEDLYSEFARHYSREGIRKGHFAIWHSILSKYSENISSDTAELAIGYGLCQRQLGQWTEAQSVFADIVRISGSTGDFAYQADALLEWSVLMRWQGRYEGTTKALAHIAVLAKANLSPQIRNRLLIEQVEMALEQNQTEEAWALVSQLQNFEVRKRVLMIEICAREDIPRFSYEAIQKWGVEILSYYDNNSSIVSRLHNLLGRISAKQKDQDTAIKHFRIALSLLIDQDNDPFALARAQTNLASLLIRVNQLTDAQILLNSAKSIQRKIGDRVGLAASMHNVRTIHRKIVS